LRTLLSNDIERNPGPDSELYEFNELSIFHLNARSIRNKINNIECLAHEYHIISISESHLDESVPNSELLIDGFFEPIRHDRNCFGGGVMIYVSEKNTLQEKI